MIIGDFDISKKVLVVAEVGNNHEGRIDVARELILKAKESGVDAVKFQTFRTEHYVTSLNEERYERLKSFELNAEQFNELSELACSLGLLFISTPFDLASVDVLRGIVDAYKIASGDNTFYPLMDKVSKQGLPVIVSTGLCDSVGVRHVYSFYAGLQNFRA